MSASATGNPGETPRSATRERVKQMLASLDTRIKRVPLGIGYRLMLLVVTAVMIVLPLIYLALVGAVGYGLFVFATENTDIFREVDSGHLAVLLYITPLLGGGIVLLFLIKPLLAKQEARVPARVIKPEEEPLLFTFVDKLAQAVRAPQPSRIEIDCQVNAAASPRRGLLSLLGKNLTLTIGMPLIVGLNLRQLTGVLAHELGHFGQGGGMTLSYIVRRISHWFARVVYERDSWDAWLDETARTTDLRLRPIFWLAQLGVWLSRKVLWVLMWIGHLVSCVMLRQMEYDADRYEARVAGSETFAETMRAVSLLGVAWQRTMSEAQQALEEKRLGDDLPMLVVANCEALPPDVRQGMLEHEKKAKTGLVDTHPADGSRIRSAGREKCEGIFTDEGPATILLRRPKALCKEVTMDFYAQVLGPQVTQAKMVESEQLLTRQQGVQEAYEAVERYGMGLVPFGWRLAPASTELDPPKDPRACAHELLQHRQWLPLAAPALREAWDRFREADGHRSKARVARSLLEAKVKIPAREYGLRKARPREAEAAAHESVRQRESALSELFPFVETVGKRMRCALQLLYTPQIERRMEGVAEMREQTERLCVALSSLGNLEEQFDSLNASGHTLSVMLGNAKGRETDADFVNRVKAEARRLQRLLASMGGEMNYTPFPFDYGGGEVSLGTYLVGGVPPAEDFGALLGACSAVMERSQRLYYRATGSLIVIAERVEEAMGLPKLESAKKPEETEEEAGIA